MRDQPTEAVTNKPTETSQKPSSEEKVYVKHVIVNEKEMMQLVYDMLVAVNNKLDALIGALTAPPEKK